LVSEYLDNSMAKKPLTTEDIRVILKYYSVGSGKEYDLYRLEKFIEKYLQSDEEIAKIFGYDGNKIIPEEYIEKLKPGISSAYMTEAKDKRMRKVMVAGFRERSRKNRRAAKLAEKENAGKLPDYGKKRLERLNAKGYTGENTGIGTKAEFDSLLKSAGYLTDVLTKIKESADKKKGIADPKIPFHILGTDIKTKYFSIDQKQLTAFNALSQSSDAGQLDDLFSPMLNSLTGDVKNAFVKKFRINEKATTLAQTSLWPRFEEEKKPLVIGTIATGAGILTYLGILYVPSEIKKIKNNDFTSLEALFNFIPALPLKTSWRHDYGLGFKDYSKTKFETTIKLHSSGGPLLDLDKEKGVSALITPAGNASGTLTFADLRKSAVNYFSPGMEIKLRDSLQKVGKPLRTQSLSLDFNTRMFSQEKAKVGGIQAADMLIHDFDFDKAQSAILNKDLNELLPDNANDLDKKIIDFQAGINYLWERGDRKFGASGNLLSLNDFNLKELNSRTFSFNLDYTDKLITGPRNSLSIHAKAGELLQDMDNHYSHLVNSRNFLLKLSENIGNPDKGVFTISSSLDYTHSDVFNSLAKSLEPKDIYEVNAALSYKMDAKHARNRVYQFEYSLAFSRNAKGENTISVFLFLHPF
ncbi:MAG: hypothetical protein WCK34_16845, partial [Bacteroidota bacterium]